MIAEVIHWTSKALLPRPVGAVTNMRDAASQFDIAAAKGHLAGLGN